MWPKVTFWGVTDTKWHSPTKPELLLRTTQTTDCYQPHLDRYISQPSREISTESGRSATYMWLYVAKNDFYSQNAFFTCNKDSYSFIWSVVENANLDGEKVKPGRWIKGQKFTKSKLQNRKFRDSQKFPWFIASSTIYCFYAFTWFFCKLLDIKERSAAWHLENAGGYSSLTPACRALILAQSSSACQTTP